MDIRFDVETNRPGAGNGTGTSEDEAAIGQFRQAFVDSDFHLLEPLHPTVNYSFAVMPADPWTLELRADKWWLGEHGRVESDTLTLNTYDLEDDEVQRETMREEALMEQEELLRIYATQGLEAAMQKAEDIAIDNEQLDEDRDDPRLFTAGPVDRFLTQRETDTTIATLEESPTYGIAQQPTSSSDIDF